MNTIRMAQWAIGGTVLAILGACHSAPTRLYDLEPAETAARVDAHGTATLRVDTLNVPASWDRIEMLSVPSAGSLRISELDHWSAPLGQLARQTLSDDLDRRLPSGSVIYPRLPKPAGALGINVDILEFNITGADASMRASWLIVPAAGPQSAKRSTASLHGAVTGTEPAAIARAWSELIGRLADRIAADAAAFAAPEPATP